MQLIDKHNAYMMLKAKAESCHHYDYVEVYTNAARIIDSMPTIEAEPIKQGRWINNTFCSECNRFPVPVDVSVPISNQELTKYFSRCPHCGAKMLGVIEDETD